MDYRRYLLSTYARNSRYTPLQSISHNIAPTRELSGVTASQDPFTDRNPCIPTIRCQFRSTKRPEPSPAWCYLAYTVGLLGIETNLCSKPLGRFIAAKSAFDPYNPRGMCGVATYSIQVSRHLDFRLLCTIFLKRVVISRGGCAAAARTFVMITRHLSRRA